MAGFPFPSAFASLTLLDAKDSHSLFLPANRQYRACGRTDHLIGNPGLHAVEPTGEAASSQYNEIGSHAIRKQKDAVRGVAVFQNAFWFAPLAGNVRNQTLQCGDILCCQLLIVDMTMMT
jgi:hypothetical protein